MFCTHCGTQNEDVALYCKKCGVSIGKKEIENNDESPSTYQDNQESISLISKEGVSIMDKKTKKTAYKVIGGVLCIIAMFKFSVIGYYPSDLPLFGSILIIGAILIYVGQKIRIDWFIE